MVLGEGGTSAVVEPLLAANVIVVTASILQCTLTDQCKIVRVRALDRSVQDSAKASKSCPKAMGRVKGPGCVKATHFGLLVSYVDETCGVASTCWCFCGYNP